MEENQQPMPKNVVVVDLTLDDNDDNDDDGPRKKRASTPALRENTAKKACTTTTHSNSTLRLDGAANDEDGDDDEIEILEGDAIPGNFTVAAACAINSAALSNTDRNDAELEIVGTKYQTRLPHVSLFLWRALLA